LHDILSYPATAVFLGTAPLLGSILWGLLTSERRLTRIETKLDAIGSDVASVRERLGKVEGKLDSRSPIVSVR